MSTMSDSIGEENSLLVGVNLASEAHTHTASHDVTLGVVAVRVTLSSLEDLRRLMAPQLHTLPADYIFLTKQGWPVSRNQERHIKVREILVNNELIRINRSYDKPRIGVRLHCGTAVGFVFVDLGDSVETLRNVIHEQLGPLVCPSDDTYTFTDRNGWPLTLAQEANLTVIDVVQSSTVVIRPPQTAATTTVERRLSPLDTVDTAERPESKRPRLQPALTYDPPVELDRTPSVDETAGKQLLISYVRAEAAEHAVCLKRCLTNLGLRSVFLDVHEIKSGVDWADSLNFAVSNCEVFVPLVTARYGETQWTNREVKLADMLSKLIIPVTFLDFWPPKCLAIQFATTQFIPWRPRDGAISPGHGEGTRSNPDKSVDITMWREEEITSVAGQIIERLKLHHDQAGPATRPPAQLSRKMSTLRSCPFSLPGEFSSLSQPREGRPLVVISLHPQQAEFGRDLSTFLESHNYEVWCSTELEESSPDTTSPSGPEPAVDPSGDRTESPGVSDDDLFSQDGRESGKLNRSSDTELCLSQLSQMSVTAPSQSYDRHRDSRLRFQEKSDEAGVVIFILSKAFALSRTSRMQVFYCEHRKRVITARYDAFCMPTWMSMLIGTRSMENATSKCFRDRLLPKIKQALEKPSQSELDSDEETNQELTRELDGLLPSGFYLYISGGTKFYHDQSAGICKAIGKKLADIDDVSIATGGFRGAGELVGDSYEKERHRQGKASRLWHILPHRDDKDCSSQASQQPDGSFQAPSSGTTVFSGSSVRQRETIVPRVLDLCLLIEGGPGAAYEAEQFSWTGRIVIPIKITGGAASGKFNVPEKIFKMPCGVCPRSWSILSAKAVSARQIATAVVSIVRSLKDNLAQDQGPSSSSTHPSTSKELSTNGSSSLSQGPSSKDPSSVSPISTDDQTFTEIKPTATKTKSKSRATEGSPKKTGKKNVTGGQRKRKTLHGEEAEGD